MERVFVIGKGVVCPSGENSLESYNNLQAAETFIAPVSRFSVKSHKAKLGAQIEGMDSYPSIESDLAAELAIKASEEAVSHIDVGNVDAVVFGTAIGSSTLLEAKFNSNIAPSFSEFAFCNSSQMVANRLLNRCKSYTVSTGCTAGLDAIGTAFNFVKSGKFSCVLAGATDATISPIVFASFDKIGALSRKIDRKEASLPFMRGRDGFVLGEGAGAVLIASEHFVKEFGLEPQAEIISWASVNSSFHMTSIRQNGEDIEKAISIAMSRGKITPNRVSLIDSHGTSTVQNDTAEYNAFKTIFRGDIPPVIAQKFYNGHALGAASAIEIVNLITMIQHNTTISIPKNIAAEPEFDFRFASFDHIHQNSYKLKIANGFSGIHSVMIFK